MSTHRDRDWLWVMSPPPLPPFSYILPANKVKTAGYLIEQAGGVQQAHDAVTDAATKIPAAKAGRPRTANDAFWISVAVNNTNVHSKSDAFKQLADKLFKKHATPAKQAFIRNLQRKSKGLTLGQLRQNPPTAD